MLSDYIFDRRAQLRMQDVIPAALLDEFVDWLAGLNYSPQTIRSYTFTAARFVRCAGWHSGSAMLISRRQNVTYELTRPKSSKRSRRPCLPVFVRGVSKPLMHSSQC
jgi:hypothetical protein